MFVTSIYLFEIHCANIAHSLDNIRFLITPSKSYLFGLMRPEILFSVLQFSVVFIYPRQEPIVLSLRARH